MQKEDIIEKVKKGNYNQNQLLGWLQALPNSTPKIKPSEYQIGDVFMSSAFCHPYVLLKKHREGFICGLLTSNAGCPEVLEQCQSRFFGQSYITKTLFITTDVQGSFMGVYQNNKHLKEVLIKLKQILK